MLRADAAALLLCAVMLGFSAAAFAEEGPAASGEPAARGAMAEERLERAETDSTASDSVRVLPDRVDVLYFHRAARCENCLKFEEYTDGVLADSLSRELRSGAVTWRVIDLDGADGEAFVERYGLVESSLVLSVVEGGEEVAWSALDGIRVFVDDETMFRRYVFNEIRAAFDACRRSR
jgi:hypothetical protein